MMCARDRPTVCSRLATQVLRKSDRFLVGIKIATRARVSCWNLSPCGQPPRSSDQPRAEGSQERDRFDQRPERGVKRPGRLQAAAEIAGLDGSGVNAPVSWAENVLENLDDLVGEPVPERQSKRRVRSQRQGGMERRQCRRFADLCRRFGRID